MNLFTNVFRNFLLIGRKRVKKQIISRIFFSVGFLCQNYSESCILISKKEPVWLLFCAVPSSKKKLFFVCLCSARYGGRDVEEEVSESRPRLHVSESTGPLHYLIEMTRRHGYHYGFQQKRREKRFCWRFAATAATCPTQRGVKLFKHFKALASPIGKVP